MLIAGDDALATFLRAAAVRPFAWGEHDCLLWLADWIVERRGIDPADGLRGRYDGAAAAKRLILAEGGTVAMLDKRFGRVGCARTILPGRGDVGVTTAFGDGLVGALVLGGSVACLLAGRGLAPGGLVVAPRTTTPLAAAWRV